MGNPMKIRASVKEGVTEVKVLMQHDMETGRRKDKDGVLIPAWYITDVKVQHNGRTVLESQWGTGISKNPYLSCRIKGGAPGDKITISWLDNMGDSRSDEAVIA
jgi:sulfur-oxidizing protein SoxZ